MLLNTHPLKRLQIRVFQRFKSLLQKIAQTHQPTEGIETIQAFAVLLWAKRIDITVKPNH
jgi:hypothetical protein